MPVYQATGLIRLITLIHAQPHLVLDGPHLLPETLTIPLNRVLACSLPIYAHISPSDRRCFNTAYTIRWKDRRSDAVALTIIDAMRLWTRACIVRG